MYVAGLSEGNITQENKVLNYIKNVLENLPTDWLNLTTHRLDIYEEHLAKTQFLSQFEALFKENNSESAALHQLPTAYDYIRLGHPLSCVLEWVIAHLNQVEPERVMSFSSRTMPIIAVLRENALANTPTQINYTGELPASFDADILRRVYGFQFELKKVEAVSDISEFDGSTIFLSQPRNMWEFDLGPDVDFFVNVDERLGSIILVNHEGHAAYVPNIQHVRRRETIAMTPANCLAALQDLVGSSPDDEKGGNVEKHKTQVLDSIKTITGTRTDALLASSGLSMQYAIVMGLIHDAWDQHKGKSVKLVIPPNCYGGTNDQARRVAASLEHVEVVDLLVDGGNDMVQSLEVILERLAQEDAVPYIIAEIPTNPRVEVPDLIQLKVVLEQSRTTASGDKAVEPVFILDQTFCPNTPFLGKNDVLSGVRAISYVSGSKFPSGGKCTAGYCVLNQKAAALREKIALHLQLCDNGATDQQYEILAEQLPSMNQRIQDAYRNTREFVRFIQHTLPEARINFVSEALAAQGFTPSVFSLDLPTKGDAEEEREQYKRRLNLQLIKRMIHEIPHESKHCVSYGQLKGCYWTVPATSTQGTTKEVDKDYIIRVAVSPDMDLALHQTVFSDFVETIRVGTELAM